MPRSNELIPCIMLHNRMTKEQAETWADKHFGDWRNTPLPKAKRLHSISKDEPDEEEEI